MSNLIDYTLDVLASSQTEMNQIANRLQRPSAKLVSWLGEMNYAIEKLINDSNIPPGDRERIEWRLTPPRYRQKLWELRQEAAKEFASNASARSAYVNVDGLTKVVAFKAIRNGSICFQNEYSFKYCDIIGNHLFDVSENFPTAVFLLNMRNESGALHKLVIRAGEIVQEANDTSKTQFPTEWTALDIFSPFRAEHEIGLEFASLWNKWVDDVIAAAQALRGSPAADAQGEPR